MDIKAAVIAVCLAFSGYLFYTDQRRESAMLELSKKYEAALTRAAGGVLSDDAVMEAIRTQVRAELATRKLEGCGPGMSTAELTRLQELQIRLDTFEKSFNLAVDKIMNPEKARDEQEQIARKATKIRDRVIALCKKR